jgi:hypothetical protein
VQAKREIHLLTTEAGLVDIKYDADTVLYSHERKLRVDALRHRERETPKRRAVQRSHRNE